MAIRRWSLFLISAATSFLAGCGGGTTVNVQNPPAPSTPPISIAFQSAPPSSLAFGVTIPVTAVVTNDPTNSGVDWTLTCQNPGSCGSLVVKDANEKVLSSQHTASGQAITYSPPASLSSNTQGINIFAFATADHTKNVNAPMTLTAFDSFLKAGTYIIETAGFVNTNPCQRVAAIILDGNGVITGGEETVNCVTSSPLSSISATVTGGSYFIGPDGRGTLTINTPPSLNLGQQGIELFSLVALSGSQALLTKTDNINISPFSNESSVGTMDLQASGTQTITGGYAFVARGVDLNSTPIAFGGVLNVGASQSISGTGSKFDEVLSGGGIVTPSSSVSGSVSVPDKFGTVQISLNTDFGLPSGSPQLFTAYVIDASHLKLIETDGTTALTGGVAIGQGSSTGIFSTFSGSYTFGVVGQDSNTNSISYTTLAAAGSFTAGSGSLNNGSIDEVQSGFSTQVSDGFSATYTVDPSGRVDTASSFTFANPNNGTGPELVFYLTGGGNPVLVLDADTTPTLNSFEMGVATGLAYPSTAGATFSGDYGLSFTQNFSGTEGDATGQICVNGSSVTCPLSNGTVGAPNTLVGTVDETLSFSPTGASALTDGFQASTTSGRLTGTLSDANAFNTNSTLSVAYYLIDSDHGFFVETDGGTGKTNPGFLTFGYLARRTPVCTGCP